MELTPTQQKVYDGIFAPGQKRPAYDPSLAGRLRKLVEDGIGEAPANGEYLVIGKYQLDDVHRCGGLYASRRDRAFAWTIPMLRGRVAHRAIEVAVTSPQSAGAPLDLIDRSVDVLIGGEEGDSVATFLSALDQLDMARLKGEANEAVVGFLTDWPPIDRRWLPRIEERARVTIASGAVRLQAKYDLAFGRPQKEEARVIIVDVKTGDRRTGHVEDLRFYALVETLRRGVPPFRVATYYTQESDFFVEEVTEAALESAARRTADGIRAISALASSAPKLLPGGHCRWCGLKSTCEPGSAWIASAAANADDY